MDNLNLNFKNNSFAEFSNCAKNKKVVLFGAGFNCKRALDIIPSEIKIEYIIDNDPWKWNTEFLEYKVCSPESLLSEDNENTVILITIPSVFEVEERLINLGIKHYYSYLLFFDRFEHVHGRNGYVLQL